MNTPTRYSHQELQEFKTIIQEKLQQTTNEINSNKKKIQEISQKLGKIKIQSPEESHEVGERESINYQIKRLEAFHRRLQQALQRIQQGNYGICATTGKLIPKERLRLVPHTTHSVAAKENRT